MTSSLATRLDQESSFNQNAYPGVLFPIITTTLYIYHLVLITRSRPYLISISCTYCIYLVSTYLYVPIGHRVSMSGTRLRLNATKHVPRLDCNLIAPQPPASVRFLNTPVPYGQETSKSFSRSRMGCIKRYCTSISHLSSASPA